VRPAEKVVVAEPVTAKFVVVAEVVVAFRAVKFWRVVEPDSRRFDSEVSPAVAVSVPVKFAVLDIV
jgi:hypothetical protein